MRWTDRIEPSNQLAMELSDIFRQMLEREDAMPGHFGGISIDGDNIIISASDIKGSILYITTALLTMGLDYEISESWDQVVVNKDKFISELRLNKLVAESIERKLVKLLKEKVPEYFDSFTQNERLEAEGPRLNIIGIVVYMVYEVVLTASKHEGTFGKKIVNIKVVDQNGQRLTISRSVGRCLGKILSAISFLIGYFMIGWTKKKTGLHDLLAGTYVVYR